jgi:hypothetical protein
VKTTHIPTLKLIPDFSVRREFARPALSALGAIMLLSGTVGTSGIAGAAKRPALTLPVDGTGRRLLDCWLDEIQQLVDADDVHGLPVRVLTNLHAHAMGPMPADNGVQVRVETDPAELRGTAGLLRDAAEDYPDDAYVLMANAAQLIARPLAQAVNELAETGADVAFFADDAGQPGALMLIRCGCLRAIPAVGFVDFKEQALPTIARHHRVSVVRSGRATSLPIRTPVDYINALRWHHNGRALNRSGDAFAEDWAPLFWIREIGADVHASARLHDSVVLSGGSVQRGAVLVRSVVCPGGVVPARATLVDAVVTASN